MQLTVTNGILSLSADTRGAEMTSLRKNGKDYLWTADPEYWPGRAPVLFPFVGRVRNGEYRLDGQRYPMPIHGFAASMDFTPKKTPEGGLLFTVRDTDDTRRIYPYPFLFTVSYDLDGNTARVCFTVRNEGDRGMYFMAGGHPGFLCPPPTHPGAPRGSCGIVFLRQGEPLKAVYSTPVTGEGLAASREKAPHVYSQESGPIVPDAHLFDRDALIAEDFSCDQVDLIDPDGRPYVRVCFDSPLVGVWSVAGREAPFVCVEPWWGRCDREDFDGELKDREWEQYLDPGRTAVLSFSVTLPD